MTNELYVIQDSLSHHISEPFPAANQQVALRIFKRALDGADLPDELRRDTDLLYLGTIDVEPDGHVKMRGVEYGKRVCSGNDPCFAAADDDDDDDVEV
nr:DNA binding protein [Microvirus sp.]